MKITRLLLLLFTGFLYLQTSGQSANATLKGVVTDQNGNPLDMVNIKLQNYVLGTSSNRDGKFTLRIPAQKQIVVVYSSLGYNPVADTVVAQIEENVFRTIELPQTDFAIDEVTVTSQRKDGGNITRIDPKFADNIINMGTGAVEAILKTQPGVSSNNELSSQYTVRGGNFDENLVYVNDVEIYRPFLIRSGQQEGLSFINSDMVSTIDFSAGGFDAKYGDKMSSVLDIKYRKPSEFRGSISASLLGGTAHFEDVSVKGKLAHISGIRYKTNRYLLGSLDEQGEYDPQFFDFQTYITYQLSNKFNLSFLGNISQNQYNFIPQTRSTSFGTWDRPLNTKIYFDGQEVDDFQTYLGALTLNYHPNVDLNMKFIASAYYATEEETYDILGDYYLNELEKNLGTEEFGDSILNLGVGSFINHARNYLDATVYSFSHRGAYNSPSHLLNWGFKFQHEAINNKINEWIFRDSTGYSIPYSATDLKLYYSLNSNNNLSSTRFSGYFQDTWSVPIINGDLYLTGGLRFNYWDLNDELLISPRINASFYPDWETKISFRLAMGTYYQTAFFKELMNTDGTLNSNSKAQKSFQIVAGSDLLFTAWDRPFRFTSEMYYKKFSRLIPYQVDNVRIRYLADQKAEGFARGIDLKVNGEFVSGLQSWASLSIMSTQEDIFNDDHYIINEEGYLKWVEQGYIPRPTDQRFNFSVFFQDYLPGNPTWRMQLTGFYGSRLPTGPPNSPRYMNVYRMPSYRRIDLGFSKILIGAANRDRVNQGFFRHINDMWISLEVFNLLNINNTISYYWVSSLEGDQFAVPNYLTGRKLNLKLTAKF